jgi:hypothetical protein
MNLLIGLLCIALFLAIVFWLLGLILNEAPARTRGIIIAIVAAIALLGLFGGWTPFYHWGDRIEVVNHK